MDHFEISDHGEWDCTDTQLSDIEMDRTEPENNQNVLEPPIRALEVDAVEAQDDFQNITSVSDGNAVEDTDANTLQKGECPSGISNTNEFAPVSEPLVVQVKIEAVACGPSEPDIKPFREEPHQTGSNSSLTKKSVRVKGKKVDTRKITGKVFSCLSCNGKSFLNYSKFLKHKRSATHRFNAKSRQAFRQDGITTKQLQIETTRPDPVFPVEGMNVTVKSALKNTMLSPSTAKPEARTGSIYNLRKRSAAKRKRVVANSDSDDKTYEYSENSLSSSSSSEDDGEEEEVGAASRVPKSSRNEKCYYCTKDGCNWHSYSQKSYEFHTKIHEPGSYLCAVCSQDNSSALDLCLHEINHFGKVNKSAPHPWKCPRCPYTARHRTTCVYHFVKEHLHLEGESKWNTTCEICSVEVNHPRSHFVHHHNIKGLDPQSILKCPEENCKAFFTSRKGLEWHRSEIHKWIELFNEDGEENRTLECLDCNKTFKQVFTFRTHMHQYHNKKSAGKKFVNLDRHVCPAVECAKTFSLESELQLHSKLHGNFKCKKECGFETRYSPHLMDHEEICRQLKMRKGYKCPDCKFLGMFSANLTDHRLETHLGVTRRVIKCKVCTVFFTDVKRRTAHLQKYHGKRASAQSHRCNKCPAYFLKKTQLDAHSKLCGVTEENPEENYFCDTCWESFKTKSGLETHLTFHGKWKCEFCPVEETFAPDLALHEGLNHGTQVCQQEQKTKMINCSRCKWFVKGSEKEHTGFTKHFLSKHLNLGTDVYVCEICEEGHVSKTGHQRHMKRVHTGKTQADYFHCDMCPAYFTRMMTLLVHKRSKHQELNPLMCKHCGKNFKRIDTLKGHVSRVHANLTLSSTDKQFPCAEPNCGKSFAKNDDLIWHQFSCKSTIKMKSQLTQVICQICGRSCRGEPALKLHMKTHNPDRPTKFKCDICSKSFKNKGNLQRHQEYHKGPEDWKFMCAVCSKKCVSKDKLEEHMRTHTKEKSFVCQVCGEKYAHKHNLQNHIKSKHKEVQLQLKKYVIRHRVSRKGKKLGNNFCFIKEQDQNARLQEN